MSKYVDAEKLIAEIDRRKMILDKYEDSFEEAACCKQELVWLKDFISSLQQEQPEVDLEKELDEWMKVGPHTCYPWCTIPDAIKITAEHFYELGLKVRKED